MIVIVPYGIIPLRARDCLEAALLKIDTLEEHLLLLWGQSQAVPMQFNMLVGEYIYEVSEDLCRVWEEDYDFDRFRLEVEQTTEQALLYIDIINPILTSRLYRSFDERQLLSHVELYKNDIYFYFVKDAADHAQYGCNTRAWVPR